MPDSASSAVTPSSAPPLFGNKPGPATASPPKQPSSPAVQRAEQSPDQRGESDRARADNMHDRAADAAGYGHDGKPWVDPARNGMPGADQAGAERTDGTAAPAETVKVGDIEVPVDQFMDVLARMGIEQLGVATRPVTPEGYELKLPDTFQPPVGADGKPISFAFDPSNPMTKDAQAWAHRNGISQGAFSEALQIVANDKLTEAAKFQIARNSEVQKLGPNATARVSAVQTWLKGVGGPDADTLIKVLDYAPVAGTVKAFENLMTRYASQGAGGFSQSHREPGEPANGRLTEAQYNALPIGDRMEYARSASSSGRR
jgi:hypothetical protein